MFESGIKACDLVDEIISEADVWPDIPKERYYEWIDEAEQLLYSEIIKESAVVAFGKSLLQGGIILDFSMIRPEIRPTGADEPRFEDVYAVYADKVQLIRAEENVGEILPDTYYKRNGKLYIHTDDAVTCHFHYYVRPILKKQQPETTIKLPPEWVCIIRSKLRGEAYKLKNEDVTAAKWINDYNVLIEQFKVYMAARRAEIGSNLIISGE